MGKLTEAAKMGETQKVLRLLHAKFPRKKHPITEVDEHGNTALHWAARNGDMTTLTLLAEEGAPVGARNGEGDTPLHLAAVSGSVDSLHHLLLHRAEIDAVNRGGFTPLFTAVRCMQLDAMKYLLEKGARIDILLDHSSSVLHWAARHGLMDVVEFLLRVRRVDPNIEDDFKLTPLHEAVIKGHGQLAVMLAQSGALVDRTNVYNQSPLDVAQPPIRAQLAPYSHRDSAPVGVLPVAPQVSPRAVLLHYVHPQGERQGSGGSAGSAGSGAGSGGGAPRLKPVMRAPAAPPVHRSHAPPQPVHAYHGAQPPPHAYHGAQAPPPPPHVHHGAPPAPPPHVHQGGAPAPPPHVHHGAPPPPPPHVHHAGAPAPPPHVHHGAPPPPPPHVHHGAPPLPVAPVIVPMPSVNPPPPPNGHGNHSGGSSEASPTPPPNGPMRTRSPRRGNADPATGDGNKSPRRRRVQRNEPVRALNAGQWGGKQDNAFEAIRWKDLVLSEPPLGEGTFGIVYRAVYHGSDVAVKSLKDQPTAEERDEAVKDFTREIRFMATLRHPNCVRVIGAVVMPPRLAVVTELCHRGSLHHIVHARKVDLPWERRLHLLRGMLRGLVFLHERKVMHRDLKPLNVLITHEWDAKLADFGLSKVRDQSVHNSTVGTPAYMAPEVINSTGHNESADMFSVGIIMWEVAVREIPFRGLGPFQVAAQCSAGKRPAPKPKGTPKGYITLMCRCWAQKPSDRLTAAQALEELTAMVPKTKK